MSTKSTIVYGPDFHLYYDLMDDDYSVNLQLDNTEFKTSNNSITVNIPAHIFLLIQNANIRKLDLANLSDLEIQQMVEKDVDERILLYNNAKESSKKLLSFCGSMVFGPANDSRENQIKSGIEYYFKEREKQKLIIEKLKNYKIINSDDQVL